MKTVLLLAVHGAPPKDYPYPDLADYFRGYAQMEVAHLSGNGQPAPEVLERFAILDQQMRAWPRSPENDPFYWGAMALGAALQERSGLPVVIGFNEFCAPDMAAAFERAFELGAERIAVLTNMLTSGGDHSEADIPEAVAVAQQRYPQVEISFTWPFDPTQVADFLFRQVNREALLKDR